MFKNHRLYGSVLCLGLLVTGGFFALRSQSTGRRAAALIHDAIDENKLVTLRGNTRPEAFTGTDLGAAADSLVMDHMMLQLKRSPELEQAARKFVDDLHDSKSPNFHKWITAEEFGKNFGVAEADIKTITGWLESQGFTVNAVYPSGMVIDFSGSAGQVGRAFHTSIHNLDVKGVRHIANVSDPQIPAALAPAVSGVVSMHDFTPHKMVRPQYSFTYQGQAYHLVVPADLAAIYDIGPLFSQGITGSGQTVAVLEDSNLYSAGDWNNFRKTFGLTQYTSGSLNTVHPAGSGANNCSNPGYNSDDVETESDAEWATAAAPGAAIVVASCDNTSSTFGVFIAMQNLVNGTNPPSIMSISYLTCEAQNGAAANAAMNTLYQQAVMEGVSIFVSAGDSGAAACDDGLTNATHGVAVNSLASTPYNVAVGGTDFGDTANNSTSAYWNRSNTSTYGSAIGYIPEIPWNDSCAGSLLASFNGFATGYGANGFCNSNTAISGGYLSTGAGGGGPSNCATGTPSMGGVASGTCKGFPKPSWQAGSGVLSDGVRDIPDVSMFAADGVWGHYYITCFSDGGNGGGPCSGAPMNWGGGGGTSFSSPVMAGVQALINQKNGGAQGNPNYVYYPLAAKMPSVFHAVTQGDIDVNCSGPVNCYGFLGTVDYGRGGRVFGTTYGGALSVSNSSFTPAYAAAAGWNFATGLGSVDVNNLVTNWSSGQ